MAELKIKPEFRDLIPKLTDEEFAQLEANILEAGEVKEPIIVWNGFIVDGHHRWYIIEKHPEIPYRIEEMDFENEHAAMAWACDNQLGRRNLTETNKKYLRGKRLSEEKMAGAGAPKGNKNAKKQLHQNDGIESEKGRGTAGHLAEEYHVGSATIERDEQLYKGAEIIGEVDSELKKKILEEEIKVPKKVIQKLPKASPEDQKKAVEFIAEGEMHKAEIVLDGDANIIEGLYDTGEEVTFTEADLLQEITINFYRYMDSIDTTLEEHYDILEDADARERIYDAYIGLLKDKLSDLEEER